MADDKFDDEEQDGVEPDLDLNEVVSTEGERSGERLLLGEFYAPSRPPTAGGAAGGLSNGSCVLVAQRRRRNDATYARRQQFAAELPSGADLQRDSSEFAAGRVVRRPLLQQTASTGLPNHNRKSLIFLQEYTN